MEIPKHTAKTYRDHFEADVLASYKEKVIVDLNKEALDNLARAAYLESTNGDIDATIAQLHEKADPLEKELAGILEIKTPLTRQQRDRKKELEKELKPYQHKIKNLEDDKLRFEENILNLRMQATERIYRRDFIVLNFPDAVLGYTSPDPHMKGKPDSKPADEAAAE